MLDLDRSKTCCFSGYRPHKFGFELNKTDEKFVKLETDITNAILDAYNKGYRNFLCGGAMGFDLVCGEIVVLLKKQISDIKLICVLPFKSQSKSFSSEWKDRYNLVIENSDDIFYQSPAYAKGCFTARNSAMIDVSSMVITYYSGRAGGTANTIAMAQRERLNIVNLYENPKKHYENLTFYIGNK